MSLSLVKTRLNFSSSFLNQSNAKSKNELIYVRDVEAVKKIRSRVLSGLKTRDECTPARFLNNT